MKKIISCILTITLAFFSFPVVANAEINGEDLVYGESLTQRGLKVSECPSITAKHAVLLDSNGTVIYERSANDEAKIASLTKIMTGIIAIENSNENEQLEISKKAARVGESTAGLWAGDKLDMKSALRALLVPSGNDAAQAISEFIGRKVVENKDDRIRLKDEEQVKKEAAEQNISEDEVEDVYIYDWDQAFCKLMNDKAEELGCTKTCFTNPHGLDDEDFTNNDQRCCALDIAKITRYAMQNQQFRAVVSGGSTSITVLRDDVPTTIELHCTDALLEAYHGCQGVKTGHTDTAGYCFSGCAVDDSGVEIYSIVLNAEDSANRFLDSQKLWDWYFTNKVDYKLANSGDIQQMTVNNETQNVEVVAYVAHSEWVDCTIPVTTQDPNFTIPVLQLAGNVYLNLNPENVSGSYKAGDKVCEVVFTQHNNEIARTNLIAVKDSPAPNIFQMIGVGFDRLIRGITGQPTVAKSNIVTRQDEFRKEGK